MRHFARLCLTFFLCGSGFVACSDAPDSGPIASSGDGVGSGSEDASLSEMADGDNACGPGFHHSGYPSGGDTDCVPDGDDADTAGVDASSDGQFNCGPGFHHSGFGGDTDCVSDTPDVDDTSAPDTSDSSTPDVTAIDVGNLADGATGGLTCTQIGQCAQDECNAKKLLCGLDCGAGATPAVTQKANDLLACLTGTCMNKICAGNVTPACMNPCSVTFCGSPMAACFADSSMGTAPCSSVFGCFDACDKAGTNVFTCQAKCYNDLQPAAQSQLADFFACSKGASSTADALNLCSPQVLACTADGKSGSGSCLDLSTCVGKCPASDNACGGGCYSNASLTAQKAYLGLAACFVANASNPGACMPQAEACASPSGTDKCANILTCIGNCQTALGTKDDKGACAMQCMHTMSQKSADAAMAVLQCASAKCPGCLTGDPGCQTCATTNCGGEILGCYTN